MAADIDTLASAFRELGYRVEVLAYGSFGEGPGLDIQDSRGSWLAEIEHYGDEIAISGERERGFVERALARAGLGKIVKIRGRRFTVLHIEPDHAGASPSEDEYDTKRPNLREVGAIVMPSVYASDDEILRTIAADARFFFGHRVRPRDLTLDDKRTPLPHYVDGFDIRWVSEARTGRPLLQLEGDEIFARK
jgi:hypothetical protein